MDMGGEVAVTEIEPIFAAEESEAFEGVEGLAAKAPTFCRINDAGESVGHDIEVGRDFQSMKDDVVTGIDDDGEKAGIHHFIKAEQQFGGANSTSEAGYFRGLFHRFF